METNNRVVADDLTEEDVEAFANTEFDGEGKPIEPAKTEEVEAEEAELEVKEEAEEEIEEEVKPRASVSSPEIKDVEGETPKERALRLTVTRQRQEMRDILEENIRISQNKPQEEDVVWKNELREKGYSEEQIDEQSKMREKILGDVRKEKLNDTFDDFKSAHPEYLVENDKDNVRYSRFLQILKTDYDFKNLINKSKEQLNSLFKRVNRDVEEELGKPVDNSNKIKAQKEKIAAISASASGGKTVSKSSEKPSGESIKKMGDAHYIGGLKLIGFDDEDFK